MNFPQKQKVPVAAPRRNNFDVSQNYIGTLDFGRLVPVNWRNCRNGEHYNVEPMSFLRCDPLVVPTFGRIKCISDSFFVPYHQIFNNWENFKTLQSYTDENGTSHKVDSVPIITPDDLAQLFDGTVEDFASTENVQFDVPLSKSEAAESLKNRFADHATPTGQPFDFIIAVVFDTNAQTEETEAVGCIGVSLTLLGKHIYNLLLSLGYRLEFGWDYQDWSDIEEGDLYWNVDGPVQSAFNLLAFIKVYLDWYQPNQFTMDSALRKIFTQIYMCNYGFAIDRPTLQALLTNVFSRCFEQDLYTASYLTPSGFAGTVIPEIMKPDFSGDSILQFSEGAYVDGTIGDIKSFELGLRYQNYIDRWRVGGQRDVDRDLVEFGVKSRDVAYHRSRLLNSYSQDIAISDVMSTNENSETGLELGSYAGKGLSYGSSHFGFDTDDDGVFLTIMSIVPVTGYVYGCPKEMEDVSLYDFYTPEFDSVGMEALGCGQLVNFGHQIHQGALDSVFGFVPRYAHLKVGHDTLAGDFRIGSLKTGLDVWHLYRNNYGDSVQNNQVFRQIYNDVASQFGVNSDNFDRLFNVTDHFEDHFYLFANFKMSLESPMRSITEQLIPYYDGEAHNEVNVELNGKQL